MIMKDGADPRLASLPIADEPLQEAALAVAQRPKGPSSIVVASVFAVAGVGLFVALNEARTSTASATTLTAPTPGAMASFPEPELALPAPKAAPIVAAAPVAAVVPTLPAPLKAIETPTLKLAPAPDLSNRLKAPAVVIDLSTPTRAAATPTQLGAAPSPTPAPEPQTAGAGPAAIPSVLAGNPSESFAARLTGGLENAPAVATPMRSPAYTVPQGAVIPAVLETAINSDLPGYTRAVVSRDVRSFDGRTILIPRGSRLVGQYKSALSVGQSRAFVVWTRLTRPDGVSVDLGSPAADELGRGGLEGEVDRRFFDRFGGSILLSVLNGIVASIGGDSATTISIGSPAQAMQAAATAKTDDISPVVKVAQGEAIRVFVARDLDFSLVGAMR